MLSLPVSQVATFLLEWILNGIHWICLLSRVSCRHGIIEILLFLLGGPKVLLVSESGLVLELVFLLVPKRVPFLAF